MAFKRKKIKCLTGYKKTKKRGSVSHIVPLLQNIFQQARAYHKAEKLSQAENLYNQILLAEPNHPETLHYYGILAQQTGRSEIAFEMISKALNCRPDYIDAHNNLGVLHHDQGKLGEAAASFQRALVLKPDYAEVHNNLGNVLRDQGKLDEAALSYLWALSLNPNNAKFYNNLGIIRLKQGKLGEAAACFQRALALDPNYVDGHYNLGNVLKEHGKLDEATSTFRRAITLKPDFAEAHNILGVTLNIQGNQDEAIACFRQALTLKPDFAEAHSNLGCIVREFGKLDDAITCFRKALSLKPDYAGAYAGLSSIVKFTEVDGVIHAMEHLYNKKSTSESDRINLGFALGKAFEDLRDYDRSFDFILEANRLKRKSFEYSLEDELEFFEKIKEIFSAEFFAGHPGSGYQDKTPIFIIGMPRSGTSLAEQILASHPLVFGAGELTVLEKLINGIPIGGTKSYFPECMLSLDGDAFARIGSDYIDKIRNYSKDAEHITDKMLYNFLHVGLIKTILPAAKVIHCARNPMDNCFSIFKKNFAGAGGFAYDITEIGQYYNLYSDLMAHWDKVLPGFMYTLRYEEMVSDQQNQTKNLLDFCGLPWDEACLNFHKKERKITTASFTQVRQPIYKDSVELWKRYEKRLEPLKKAIYG